DRGGRTRGLRSRRRSTRRDPRGTSHPSRLGGAAGHGGRAAPARGRGGRLEPAAVPPGRRPGTARPGHRAADRRRLPPGTRAAPDRAGPRRGGSPGRGAGDASRHPAAERPAGAARRRGRALRAVPHRGGSRRGRRLFVARQGGRGRGGQPAEPGRRRWTAAHELGHHLLQDTYHSDIGVAAAESERERVIDAFAGEFLLPQQELRRAWQRFQDAEDPRQPLMWLSATYRVSWSAAVAAAVRTGLVPAGGAPALRVHTPPGADLRPVVAEEPPPALPLGTVGARWRQAVLTAYTAGAITGARAVELLPGQPDFGEDDLPTLDLDGDDP